jgi:4-hydroxy-3-methylbut-2-enyl diphosphate reductase
VGESRGIPSHLVQRARDLDTAWLDGVEVVGVTAGASAPEDLVQDIIEGLSRLRPVAVEALGGPEENIAFRLPQPLASPVSSRDPLRDVRGVGPGSEEVEPA